MRNRLIPLHPAYLLTPLLLLFLGPLARLVWLQCCAPDQGPRLERKVVDPAPRAPILDREGRVLAIDVPAWTLYLDARPETRRYTRPEAPPLESPEARERAARELTPLALDAGLDPEHLIARELDPRVSYAVLARRLGRGAASRVRARILALPGCGLHLRRAWRRLYPQGRVLGQAVGYTGPAAANQDGGEGRTGKSGLEAAWDARLRGRDGWRRTLAVAASYGIDPALDQESPQEAPPLRTTFDARLAALLQEEVQRLLEEHHPDWVAGLILDPRDCEVLAIGGWPDLDPNAPGNGVRGPNGELRGLDWPGTWPLTPGSTMKPLVVGCALASGAIHPEERFPQHGGAYSVGGGRIVHNARGVPDRPLDWREILVYSSNIGAVQVGQRLGSEALRGILHRFALDRVECPGLPWRHHAVRLPSAAAWKRPSDALPSVSFGRAFTTPLVRLASAHAAIVTGGILHEPYCVEGAAPPPVGRVLPAAVAERIRWAMVDMVREPSRKWLHDPDLDWGAKSGTVEKNHVRGYTSLLCGFAPADDPRYLVLIAVDQPKGREHYGSRVCGPSVRRLLHRALEMDGTLPPSLDGGPSGAILRR